MLLFFFFNSFISTLTKTTYNVKQILQYNTYITTMSYTKHPTNNYVTFLIIYFFSFITILTLFTIRVTYTENAIT